MVENANLIEDPNALDTAQAKNSGEFIAGNEGSFFFSGWGSFPCYLLHFGGKICVLHAFWS
jgi:hypothetical protein